MVNIQKAISSLPYEIDILTPGQFIKKIGGKI